MCIKIYCTHNLTMMADAGSEREREKVCWQWGYIVRASAEDVSVGNYTIYKFIYFYILYYGNICSVCNV